MANVSGKKFAGLALFLSLALTACAPELYLRTTAAQSDGVTGTYTLILYGGRHSSDIENVAILAKEGTGYTFVVYAPEFDYKVRRTVPAEEALEAARRFVGFHHAFRRSQLSRVMDNRGETIGYEVKPLYSPLDFGYADVLDITYTLRDNKVTVRIRLIPELERPPFRDDSPFLFRFRR